MLKFRLAAYDDCVALSEMESKYIECPWSVSVLRQTVADELSAIYLLCDDVKIVGYGGLKMALDTAEVYNIVVDESCRRRGYGSLILEKLFEHATMHGAKEMFLEVNESNEPAMGLYISHGFKISHMRKNYYKSGNALILKREI